MTFINPKNMIHRLILTSFSFLSLAMCQNQTTATSTEKVTDATMSGSIPPQKSAEGTDIVTPEKPATMPPAKGNSTTLPPAKTEAYKKEADLNTPQSGMIYLSEGENKFLKEYGMNLTFKKMVEDSRCPEGVNCIWEGVATAELEVMGLETRPMTIKISSMQDASKGYSRTQNFNGYNITLGEVTPTTTSDRGFKALQGKYKIGIKISKGNSGSSGTTTK